MLPSLTVIPAKAGIQQTPTIRLNHKRWCCLDRPVKPGDDRWEHIGKPS
jgi:hypothetical protein